MDYAVAMFGENWNTSSTHREHKVNSSAADRLDHTVCTPSYASLHWRRSLGDKPIQNR
jgi:hypothetical protein